ncbi:MAG TPA: EAL domain-containing protein [Thermoanaerobaculia bacterium]|nr:EAL domain-containing protein [Thermoanaerobaculia bacterium]
MTSDETQDRRSDAAGDWLDATFSAADHELASGLRRAIGRHELELAFEPVVGLDDGRPVGAEALVRWRHPRRGLLRSDELLPLAERTGLILPLGDWLFEQVCRRRAFWQRTGAVDDGFWLAVRLSSTHLDDALLCQRIATVLARSGCRREALVLELSDPWPARRPGMAALQELGIRLAVDELAAGRSSVAALRELAPELIKIDPGFVRGLTTGGVDARLVGSVLVLAEAFGSIVVAQGVETRAQAARLRQLGCSLAQGFHFSPPLSEAELLALALTRVAA